MIYFCDNLSVTGCTVLYNEGWKGRGNWMDVKLIFPSQGQIMRKEGKGGGGALWNYLYAQVLYLLFITIPLQNIFQIIFIISM